MEKFLREYVKMIAETREIEINDDQLDDIVNSLQEEDEIWDVLDSYITRALLEVEGKE